MTIIRLGLLAMAAAGMTVMAQGDAEFEEWMKACGSAQGALRKLDPKTGKDAVSNAEKIAGTYEKMIGFWRQRNAADAVKWSEEGKAAALQLASAASANDAERAGAAFGKLGSTCKSCHDVHREKIGENKYRIK
jgi:cytochrome c556